MGPLYKMWQRWPSLLIQGSSCCQRLHPSLWPRFHSDPHNRHPLRLHPNYPLPCHPSWLRASTHWCQKCILECVTLWGNLHGIPRQPINPLLVTTKRSIWLKASWLSMVSYAPQHLPKPWLHAMPIRLECLHMMLYLSTLHLHYQHRRSPPCFQFQNRVWSCNIPDSSTFCNNGWG